MEHIRQYDWCTSTPDNYNFVYEHELDNCVTEQILQNKFVNPLISSDSEDENRDEPYLDWDKIFKRKLNEKSFHRVFVPGLRPLPAYPRLSSLTQQQHHHCLRVLCAQNPHILPDEFMPRPNKFDYKYFEDIKEIYQKEQEEFIAWAKTSWTNGQCIRAIRPKPQVEAVYEAEFKMRAQQMKGYPKVFEIAAQIPLETSGEFEMVMVKELIGVQLSQLPEVQIPHRIEKRFTVLRPCSTPEPCDEHPVRFVLPGEKSVSILPLTEVHRELAQYAADNELQFVASESAVRCLVQRTAWSLPLSVWTMPTPQGDNTTVIVLGSEFANKRENVMTRTFRAYRHLLESALVPQSEMAKMFRSITKDAKTQPAAKKEEKPSNTAWMDASSDDEENNLCIDFDEDVDEAKENDLKEKDNDSGSDMELEIDLDKEDETKETENKTVQHDKSIAEGFGVYKCTCKESTFQRPPPRSFRAWQLRNKTTSENINILVHCAHKFKGTSGEVLIEPILDYQVEVGASKQSEDRARSLALSLALRNNASVINVRMDVSYGDVVTIEELPAAEFKAMHSSVAGTLHTALSQLTGLVPGHYILLREPHHGDNVLLYAPRAPGGPSQLTLHFDSSQLAEADEAKSVKLPPTITPDLLPWHKFRKILPCAFTPYPNQVAKEPKKQPLRQKTPPQALKWPKKKGGRKPKTQRQ